MIIIGLDIGDVRTGLAIADTEVGFAFERGVVDTSVLITKLEALLNAEPYDEVVIGLPLALSGQDTLQTAKVRQVADQIKQKLKLRVVLKDERMSSVMTKSLPGGKTDKDALAAKIILQNYIDEKTNNSKLET